MLSVVGSWEGETRASMFVVMCSWGDMVSALGVNRIV